MTFEALDIVIALVIVILALSLFVQSLQSLLKKMFKIKSLQIENSLVHLFYNLLGQDTWEIIRPEKTVPKIVNNSPILRMAIRTQHPSEYNAKVAALYKMVAVEFIKAGRVTSTGKMMLDSISKEDLKKFIGSLQRSNVV